MASALQTLFSDIANAIRGKTGNADKMSPSSFPTQIENIPTTGGGESGENGYVTILPLQTVTIPYESTVGCGMLTIPHNIEDYGGEIGDSYVVWFDNVPYALPLVQYSVKFGALNGTSILFGNPTIQKSVVVAGALYSYTWSDMPTSQGNLSARQESFNFNISEDGVTIRTEGAGKHKIRIDYVPVPEIPQHSVNFYSGDEFLYTRTVNDGEDCPDPMQTGDVDPLLTSIDSQNIYEYAGWARTNGGEVDSSVLTAISADTNVYATFGNAVPLDYSQTCGNGVYWQISNTDTLYIHGSGVMSDYDALGVGNPKPPWKADHASTIKAVKVLDGVTYVGNQAFSSFTAATKASIADSVLSTGQSVFSGCSALKTAKLPSRLTELSRRFFYNCASLTSVEIPDSVTVLGDNLFYGCKALTSVDIPNGVTAIPEYAFYSCSALAEISIPDNVSSIGNRAFYLCKNLKNITIPVMVTSIGMYAFSSCSNLATAEFEDPNGWYVTATQNATSGTNVSLADTTAAATLLKTTHESKYWYNT